MKKLFVKKLLLSLLVVVLACSSLVALVGCDKETVFVDLNYQIVENFSRSDDINKGSLLTKPSDPIYSDGVFNCGIGGISGGWADFTFDLSNNRMGEGFIAEKNYLFIGWYKEAECIRPWVFSEDRIFEKTTLYAKWTEKTW